MLRFGIFAKLVKTATGQNEEDTVNILLGCVSLPLQIGNTTATYEYRLNQVECRRLLRGEKNLSRNIRYGAEEIQVKEQAQKYFEEYVVPLFLPDKKDWLSDEIKEELRKDEVMTKEQKDAFSSLLKEETFAEGLSRLCLYLFTQPNKLEDISALIKSIKNLDQNAVLHTSNQHYVDHFTNTLFLDSENGKVTLKNLFIWPDYSEANSLEITSLKERIQAFLSDKRQKLLIVEGDAGTGKSSLISCLNYMAEHPEYDPSFDFCGRRVVTVRLCEMDREERAMIAKGQSLLEPLSKHLHQSLSALSKIYAQTLYILDGYNELCTGDSDIHAQSVIEDLAAQLPNYEGKLILTTRPAHITAKENAGMKKITLKRYSPEQQRKWVEKYVGTCGKKIPESMKNYLQEFGDEKTIFDVPLNLYMLAAKKTGKEKLFNAWSLYREILYRSIREENEKQEQRDDATPEISYQICEEIAYEMYKNGNCQLSVDAKAIRSILGYMQIKEREKKKYLENFEENYHALCGFWKTDFETKTFEFYHNDIRDFFLCEKIYRELNRNYPKQKYQEANAEGVIPGWREKQKQAAKALAEFFQYGRLEKKVLDFLSLRSGYPFEDGKETDFCKIEKKEASLQKKFYPYVSQIMITNEEIYPKRNETDYYANIALTVKSMWEAFASIYQPLLKKEERVPLWENVKVVNETGILKELFWKKADGLFLRNVDFRGIALPQSYFRRARLEGSDLSGADFSNADITFARLDRCRIDQTDFNGAHLNGIESEMIRKIRKLPNLKWADFTGNNVQRWKEKLNPGSLYEFGHDPLSPDGKEKILWRVLDIQDGAALLLAEQVLVFKKYHSDWTDITWKKSDLCKWLNEDSPKGQGNYKRSFWLNAFSEEERARIIRRKVEALRNPHSSCQNIDPGDEISDDDSEPGNHIFLLNIQEAMKYFASKGYEEGIENDYYMELGGNHAIASATDYAGKAVKEGISRDVLEDAEGNCWWWLRSPGYKSSRAAYIYPSGRIDCYGYTVNNEDVGVRPALWLKLNEVEI